MQEDSHRGGIAGTEWNLANTPMGCYHTMRLLARDYYDVVGSLRDLVAGSSQRILHLS